MTNNDHEGRYSAVVALLNRDRNTANNPTFTEMERISSELAGRTVHGVKIKEVPRTTANDVLCGKHKSRLRWELAVSLRAVIHHIAEQQGIAAAAMTPWEEFHRSFYQPRTTAAEPPPEWRHAHQGPTSPCRAPAAAPGRAQHETPATRPGAGRPGQASGRGTGLISCDPLAASMGLGAPFLSVAGAQPLGHSPRQAARELLDRIRADDEGWWSEYRPLIPEWLRPYLTLERLLSLIRVYAPHCVPGLLQAPGYARHLITQDLPDVEEAELARRVELRKVRQQILHRPDPRTTGP